MLLSDTYLLAKQVKSKLTQEALNPNTNLLRLVTQANLLDNLIDNISTRSFGDEEDKLEAQKEVEKKLQREREEHEQLSVKGIPVNHRTHVKFNLPPRSREARTIVTEISEEDYDNDYDIDEEIVYHSIYSSDSDSSDDEELEDIEEESEIDYDISDDDSLITYKAILHKKIPNQINKDGSYQNLPSLNLNSESDEDISLDDLSDYSDDENIGNEEYPNLIYTSSISDDEESFENDTNSSTTNIKDDYQISILNSKISQLNLISNEIVV